MAALDALHCRGATALATRIVELTAELTRQSAELSDTLYEVIGTAGPHKAALVAIRRDLHGLRRPKRPGLDVLPPELADRVREWTEHWEDRERARARLPDVLAAEARTAWGELRKLAAAPTVRHALAHASPALSEELEKWLADPDRRPRTKTLAGLLRYVVRAAAKTSPFSTFTIVHSVHWTPEGPALRVPDAEPQVVVEADVGLRLLVESVLPHWPALAAARVVRLSPTVRSESDTLAFTGTGQGEPNRALDRTATLDALVDLLRAEQGARWDVVAEKLAGQDRAQVEKLLAGMTRIGLTETAIPVSDQSSRPFGDLADWASAEGVADVAWPLDRLQRELDPVEPLGAGDPAAGGCARVGHRLGAELPALGLPVMTLTELRRRVLRESALGPPVDCGLLAWKSALADLELVRRWLAVHDPMLPLRLTLAACVRRWFGPGGEAPLLEVHRRVRAEKAADPKSPLRPDFLERPDPLVDAADPRLRLLRDLRTTAVHVLSGGPAAVEAMLASLPVCVRDPGPVACYVQPVAAADGLRLVLNAAHGGHGRGQGRWTRLMPGSPERVPAPDVPIAAELPAAFGHSLNLRAPVTGWELEYPGAVGQAPPDRRIPLTELVVRHDSASDLAELRWRTADAPVTPVHGGMMSETLLPPLARLLVEGFGTTQLTHPTLPAIPPQRAGDGVLHRPRIDLGRVTVARAQWTVPANHVPLRGKGDSDAEHLVRVLGWLAVHGIPRRCFVRVRDRQVARDRLAFDKRHKPVFVDFGSWPSFLEFDRIVERTTGELELAEALPDGDRAVEFLIELDRAPKETRR